MIYVIIVFVVMFLISIKPMFKQKRRYDFIVVMLLYLATLAVCLLVVGGVKLPSSSMALANLMKSIGLHYPPLE